MTRHSRQSDFMVLNRRSTFSPLSIFSGGIGGGWYDPSDISTMFQDSAGTIPVTASGQSVGKILDKSGNGNHLIQATTAWQPVYTVASGLAFLVFDGVDDNLQIASATQTDASGHHSTTAAIKPNGVVGTQNIGGDNSNTISQNLRLSAATPQTIAFNTLASVFTDSAADVTAVDMVLSQITALNACEVKTDGVGNGSTAITGSMKTGAAVFALGTAAGGFLGGRIYQFVHAAKQLSNAEQADLITFCGAKQGRVL